MTLRLGVGVVLPDILNVRDFGAKGDGATNDASAIQAAIDSAFGTAGSPHGTSATLNKALYFPGGIYLVNSPLVFTQVRGARIYGAGQNATTINANGGAVTTNGMEYCSFENMLFEGTGASTAAFELDWDGTGSVGLRGNMFTNCGFGGPDYGMRIALSGHGGTNNAFYACSFANCPVAGMATWTSGATGQTVQGGQTSSCATGFWIKAGQIASVNDVGLSGNTAQDILMDSDGPILVKGNRTESVLSCVFNSATGVAVLDGHSASAGVGEFCRTKGKVICDSCTSDSGNPATVFSSDATYTGTAYLRGCSFPQAGFLTFFAAHGTIAQNI